MGDCYHGLASYDHAPECYYRALALKPESAYARYNSACLAMKCADQTGAGAPGPERRAAHRK
jgi:hypothetical protein